MNKIILIIISLLFIGCCNCKYDDVTMNLIKKNLNKNCIDIMELQNDLHDVKLYYMIVK